MDILRRSHLLRWLPHFHALHDGGLRRCPPEVRDWIGTHDSLTRRLRQKLGSGFTVRLLGQRWGLPGLGEAAHLGIPATQRVLIREVLLLGHGQPLIAARSILPASVLRYTRRSLLDLGARPLGDVLFAHGQLGRTDLVYASVSATCWRVPVQEQLVMAERVWARRSRYTLAGRPLLVAEFFLPPLFSGSFTASAAGDT